MASTPARWPRSTSTNSGSASPTAARPPSGTTARTDAATPVATVSSWPTPLTLPGDTSVSGWAISSVTVAPTHQRRGIARALLEAELRTADSLGVPLAILTVSEATIYSRFGFAPTTMTADLEIDTRRASWTGPTASGRVQFISLEQLNEVGRDVAERARRGVPGEIELDDHLWGRLIGLLGDEKGESKNLRAVIYHDAAGQPQGFALYRLEGDPADFSSHTATVEHLRTVTDDAYAGLWRYLLELPLVSTVSAPLRSVDEPLVWQVSDPRAVRAVRRRDHLWARILDVTAALEARALRRARPHRARHFGSARVRPRSRARSRSTTRERPRCHRSTARRRPTRRRSR